MLTHKMWESWDHHPNDLCEQNHFFFLGHLQFLNRYANVAVLTPCFVSPQSPFIPAAVDRRERQEGTMLLTMGFGISLEKSAQPLTSWEQSVTTWASFCEFNQPSHPHPPTGSFYQRVAEVFTQNKACPRRKILLLRNKWVRGVSVGSIILQGTTQRAENT